MKACSRLLLLASLGVAPACAQAGAPPGAGGAGGAGDIGGAGGGSPLPAEAGFVEAPARDVTLRGAEAHIGATARLFYNFEPADEQLEQLPIFVLFNGFSANVVRGFGTGRSSVAEGGEVVSNPASLTALANLLYIEPRQAGFSYDLGGDEATRCSSVVFNEYVDAADVLFGVLAFLDDHPELRGPVFWVGESYAGVRIQWILSYLRGASSLAPYADPLLEDRIAAIDDRSRLMAGQILLDPWLLGQEHAAAIAAACFDASTLDAVSASVGAACAGSDACACTTSNGRSLYNYAYTSERQETRIHEANAAHVTLDKAELLFGLPLASIAGLSSAERDAGFKCNALPDDDAPPQGELFAALGALADGQAYFLPYSPLQPGKALTPIPADWRNESILGPAFIDNLRDVPAFVTDGQRDLVVPIRALAPALRAVVGEARVNVVSAERIEIDYDDGPRAISIAAYPEAGHMITMIEPEAFRADVAAWLALQPLTSEEVGEP